MAMLLEGRSGFLQNWYSIHPGLKEFLQMKWLQISPDLAASYA
jgi:hypothetical protein